MKCTECKYYVGDVDETIDCYQQSCPYIDRDFEDYDWRYEEERWEIED